MTANGYLQLAFYLVVLIALAKPLGAYMARIYEGQPGAAQPLGRAARARHLSRLRASTRRSEMRWTEYALAMLVFNLLGVLAVYAPAAPAGVAAAQSRRASARSSPDSSFNTAVSFVTNTNWQGYGGETTMSYLTQMLGAHGAELRLRRDRHGGAGRADPRLRAPERPTPSATSGWT